MSCRLDFAPWQLEQEEGGVENGWMELKQVNLRAAPLEFVCSFFHLTGRPSARLNKERIYVWAMLCLEKWIFRLHPGPPDRKFPQLSAFYPAHPHDDKLKVKSWQPSFYHIASLHIRVSAAFPLQFAKSKRYFKRKFQFWFAGVSVGMEWLYFSLWLVVKNSPSPCPSHHNATFSLKANWSRDPATFKREKSVTFLSTLLRFTSISWHLETHLMRASKPCREIWEVFGTLGVCCFKLRYLGFAEL